MVTGTRRRREPQRRDAAGRGGARAGRSRRAPPRSYGPVSSFAPPGDTLDPALSLPEVRRYDVPGSRGLVRVEPAGAGDDRGRLRLGRRRPGVARRAPARARRCCYAGDLSAAEIRRAALAGGDVVVSDSNRRRVFVASRPRQSAGWTLPASVPFSSDSAVLDPFDRGPDAQTVRRVRGRGVRQRAVLAADRAVPRAPAVRGVRRRRVDDVDRRPDARRPAALGRGEARRPARHPVRRRPAGCVEPAGGGHARGRRRPRRSPCTPAGTGCRCGCAARRRCASTITGHRTLGQDAGSVGGIREVRVPGLHVRELLRPPVGVERALAGAGPDAHAAHLRVRAHDGRRPAAARPRAAGVVVHGQPCRGRGGAGADGAWTPRRASTASSHRPRRERWRADGWVTSSPSAPDPALDRLAGARFGGASFSGSGRFQGRPGWRASSAFDGDGSTAWVAPWVPGTTQWLSWRTSRPHTLRRLALVRSSLPARVPDVGAVVVAGRADAAAARGSRRLGRAATAGARALVPASRCSPRAGRPGRRSPSPSCAGPECRGSRCRARAACVGRVATSPAPPPGKPLALRVSGTVADLDAGRPLRARSCGAPLSLPAGRTVLHVPGGVLRPLTLRLRSAAPDPVARAALLAGRVLDPGKMGRGSYDGVRVQVSAPSWLVLGESYNRGWHAECDGKSLGAPQVVDGYANGWRVQPGCSRVSLTFGPQKAVWWGYAIGALGCLLLLGILLLRRPRRAPEPIQPPFEVDDSAWRLPLRRALLAGVAASLVFGFVFALRAGVVIGPVVALVLWRGMSPRAMLMTAGALLAIVVPAALSHLPRQRPRRLRHRLPRRAPGRALGHGGEPWSLLIFALRQYGQSGESCPSRRRSGRGAFATSATLIATLRANHGSSASWRSALRRPLRRAQRRAHAAVLRERALATRVDEVAPQREQPQQRERHADRGERVVHEHRPAGPDARAPARDVVHRRAQPVGAVHVQQVDRPRNRVERVLRRQAHVPHLVGAPRRARGSRGTRRCRPRPRPPSRGSPAGRGRSRRAGRWRPPRTPVPPAARASTIADRPRKLPISTIRPPGGTARARSQSRRACPSDIQPSTSSTAASAALEAHARARSARRLDQRRRVAPQRRARHLRVERLERATRAWRPR